MSEDTIEERDHAILTLSASIQQALQPGLDPKLQTQIARLVGLLPKLAEERNPVLESSAGIAARALLAEKPNLELGRRICDGLEKTVLREKNILRSIFSSRSPALKVVMGLGTLLYIVIPLGVLVYTLFNQYDHFFGIPTDCLGLVSIAGALGSIASIMVRLRDFTLVEAPDSTILFFTGLFKPIVGMAFALFVYTVLRSGLVPLDIQPEKSMYFFAALSFVAGFSERFAQDVMSKAEDALGDVQEDDRPQAASATATISRSESLVKIETVR